MATNTTKPKHLKVSIETHKEVKVLAAKHMTTIDHMVRILMDYYYIAKMEQKKGGE